MKMLRGFIRADILKKKRKGDNVGKDEQPKD